MSELGSRAGSVMGGSVRSEGTMRTDNTYMREFNPTFKTYTQYIFTVLAAVISSKEIWRFPYTVIGHDSGAFVLLYIVFTLTVGIPVVYLELIIGARFKLGAIKAFNTMGPRSTGIGVSHLILSFLFLIYQPLVMAWALYYLYSSLNVILPWSTCPVEQATMSKCCVQDSSTYYWFERVLNVSTGVQDPEPTHQSHILACFLLSWFIAFLCLVRGLRLGAVISYFTVSIPLLILPVLFIGVLFLEGSGKGVLKFLTPSTKSIGRISLPLLLLDLMSQILNTCGVALGILMTFKSRAKEPGYPTFESLLIGFSNMFMSLLSGMILYGIIGHLTLVKKRRQEEMYVSRGASIMFSIFPIVFSKFMVPSIWSILFFVALVLISLDSMYGQVNAITLSLMEVGIFAYIPYTTLSFIIVLLSVLLGLPFTMGNGVYLFEELDGAIAPVICFAALIEVVYVAWIYGLDKLDEGLEEKTGLKMNEAWKWMIKWFIPAVLFAILISWGVVSIIEHPSYMKYVGCIKGGYKGLKGSSTWFRKTYLTYTEIAIEVTIFILTASPIPILAWYYWPKSEEPPTPDGEPIKGEYERFE